jgi:hypothetical protein
MAILTTRKRIKDTCAARGLDAQKVLGMCQSFLGMEADDTECIIPDKVLVAEPALRTVAGTGIIVIGG